MKAKFAESDFPELNDPYRAPSRSALKLAWALREFGFKIDGWECADFGANAGGFTAVLLNLGAKHVYTVERGYGVLDWNLQQLKSVTKMERVNAMHVTLPKLVDLIVIDVGWTRQKNILPNALKNLKPNGYLISLVKPHYESHPGDLRKGKLPLEKHPEILSRVVSQLDPLGLRLIKQVSSPITGKSSQNSEYLWWLKRV